MSKQPNLTLLFSHPVHFLSLGLGTGLAPKAPGTVGTLVGFPLFWIMKDLPFSQQLIVLAVFFLLGIYFCDVTGRALGVADHGGIVWDEIVAMMLVLTITPPSLIWWAIAFALFRLFDIWKPFPIKQLDANVKGGFGVMLDDLIAAIYAIGVVKVLLWMS